MNYSKTTYLENRYSLIANKNRSASSPTSKTFPFKFIESFFSKYGVSYK